MCLSNKRLGMLYLKHRGRDQKTHLAYYMFCEDCKPIPHPALNRICPGFYTSHTTGEEFKDKQIPTYSEFFNKESNCIYEKPWVVSPEIWDNN